MTRFLETHMAGVTIEIRQCDGCASIFGAIETPIGPRPLPALQATALLEYANRHGLTKASAPLAAVPA